MTNIGARAFMAFMFLVGLTHCFEPQWDENLVVGELQLLQRAFESREIDSSWDYAFLLDGISRETLMYISEKQDHPISQSLEIPFRFEMRTLPSGALELLNPSVFNSASPKLDGFTAKGLNNELNVIRAETEPWIYEMLDRNIRIPHMCKDQCGCLADRLSKVIQNLRPDLHILDAWTHIIKRKDTGQFYAYHRAVFVFEDNKIGVLDPLFFNDTQLHSYSEWRAQFIPLHDFSLKFYPYK